MSENATESTTTESTSRSTSPEQLLQDQLIRQTLAARPANTLPMAPSLQAQGGGSSSATSPRNNNRRKRLSMISEKYDVEGKGFLSENQQMLRNVELGDSSREFFLEHAKELDASDLRPFVKRHKELRNDNEELRKSQMKLLEDNRKLRRNQLLLGIVTVLFGIATIASTVTAIKASKDTVVGADGVLAGKNTGRAVVTQSKGVSIVSELHPKGASDTDDAECVRMEDVAALYKAFGEGTDVRILTNDTAATGIEHPLGSSLAFPVTKVQGSNAGINDTHVTIGDATFDIAADNPCNTGGRKYPRGPRKLFHDHLHGRHLERRRRDLAEELTKVENGHNYYQAVVIGAGWAGISAVAQLLKKGVDNILLLEAQDYIGGRSQTVTNFATSPEGKDVPFELGSEFLFTKWGNDIVDVFDEHDVTYTQSEFGKVGAFFDPDFPALNRSFVDDTSYSELRSEFWTNGFLAFLQSQLKSHSDADFKTIVEEYVAEEGMDDDLAVQFFAAEVNNNLIIEYGGDIDKLSAKNNAEWLNLVATAGMALTSVPDGGYASAINGFVDDHGIKEKVMFGADVQEVRYDGELVEIDYYNAKDGLSSTVLAQTVLVTASLGVLKSNSIEFLPELPEEKLEAIDAMEMGVLDKLVMWWDEDTMGKSPVFAEMWDDNMDKVWLELVTPETETSDDWTIFLNSRKFNGLHSLSAWIGGSAALTMEENDDDDEILNQVVSNLRKMFGPDVQPPTKFKLTRWGTDPHYMGSYSFQSVGLNFEDTAKEISRSVDGKVFFAGEHTSDSGWAATCVGAFETGQSAANAMAKSISHEVMVSVNYEYS